MNVKLTVQERLKDLRVKKKLTLTKLAEATGLSSSALGEYENNETKDITSYALEALSKFYGVTIDYLLGVTENRFESLTPLEELHLSDDAISVLKNANINSRLVSEIISHPLFLQLLIDSEIFVDRIATSNINSMNSMIDATRSYLISTGKADPNDLHMQTLKAAQLTDVDIFGATLKQDLMSILIDIQETHKTDPLTSDETTVNPVKEDMEFITNYVGSQEEAKAALLLKKLGIKYNKISRDEFVTFINILRKSDLLKTPNRKRGKKSVRR